MTLWDDVKQNIGDWYGVAAVKTNELAKVGVRRYDIFGLSRDIERQFVEMGSLVYTALNEGRTDLHEDPVLGGLMERVRSLEAELKDKESEIDDIRRTAQTGAAAGVDPADADAASEADPDVEVDFYEVDADETSAADGPAPEDAGPDAEEKS